MEATAPKNKRIFLSFYPRLYAGIVALFTDARDCIFCIILNVSFWKRITKVCELNLYKKRMLFANSHQKVMSLETCCLQRHVILRSMLSPHPILLCPDRTLLEALCILAVPTVFCPRRLQPSRVHNTACSDAWVSLQQ